MTTPHSTPFWPQGKDAFDIWIRIETQPKRRERRVHAEKTKAFQGGPPAHGGTESAGTTRIQERLLGFRKAPVPDPLSKNRIPAPIRITKSFSALNR
jgi:hypothetical protein